MIELKMMYLELLKAGEDLHVRLMEGNSKTGKKCMTVSLIPGHDCQNCKVCIWDCYDINNVCWQKPVQKIRALNSAIHQFDIAQYWNDVEMGIKINCVTELRINVGGDLKYEDFMHIKEIAKRNPKCDFLFFTKNYDDINNFHDENDFTINVRDIMSRWAGLECDNRHNLPEAHVLKSDGTTTAPEFGSYFCKGNCSECHYNEKGCWTMKNGESVIFIEH